MKLVATMITFACLVSCVSVSRLPQSRGRSGGPKYQEETLLKGVSFDKAYDSAKSGLGAPSFVLKRADKSQGVVKGEHGITLNDWNAVAGVYLRQEAEGVRALVVVEGSKDIDFRGDSTSFAWTAEIIEGMRAYLRP